MQPTRQATVRGKAARLVRAVWVVGPLVLGVWGGPVNAEPLGAAPPKDAVRATTSPAPEASPSGHAETPPQDALDSDSLAWAMPDLSKQTILRAAVSGLADGVSVPVSIIEEIEFTTASKRTQAPEAKKPGPPPARPAVSSSSAASGRVAAPPPAREMQPLNAAGVSANHPRSLLWIIALLGPGLLLMGMSICALARNRGEAS